MKYVIIRAVTDQYINKKRPVGVFVYNDIWATGRLISERDAVNMGLQRIWANMSQLEAKMSGAVASDAWWRKTKKELPRPFELSGPFELRSQTMTGPAQYFSLADHADALFNHFVRGK